MKGSSVAHVHPQSGGDLFAEARHDPAAPRRRPAAEIAVLSFVVAATVFFAVYGVITDATSTVAYVVVVLSVTLWCAVMQQHHPVPIVLVIGLATIAVAHLAGGLVRVSGDPLYDAWIGSETFRYDHAVHPAAMFTAVLTAWYWWHGRARDLPVVVWILVGVGVGGMVETVEFLSTVAQHGHPVDAYNNVGWDLVANFVGVLGAAAVIVGRLSRSRVDVAAPEREVDVRGDEADQHRR